MSKTMSWYGYLNMVEEATEEAGKDQPDQELYDLAHEVADSCVPVYDSEIMRLASENIDLATSEPELGPAFDGSLTPVNIVAANIYDAFYSWAIEVIQRVRDEIEEEL